MMEEWAAAVGVRIKQGPPPPVVIRPFAVELPISEHQIEEVRDWATDHFGPIHGSWAEHCCYTMVMGTGDFRMRTRFEFQYEDDAFAFKMRWG
jgi:hypothetical protein